MKKTIIILIIAIPIISFNLKPFVFVRSKIKIEKLLVLPPVSVISVITKTSQQQIDNELSSQAFDAASSLLRKSFPDSIETTYFSGDSITMLKLNNFVGKIAKEINSEKRARKYQLPDSILSLFDNTKDNFIFCTINAGFKRTRNNLVNNHQASEIANFLIGINSQPLEQSASMTCIILDLKLRNILFFERNIWQNNDPTDFKILKLQFTKIITHYFI